MIFRKPRILFVRNQSASFVQWDLKNLRRCYPLTDCHLRSRCLNPITIWCLVRRHDLVVGWFASWHTLLPLLFARIQRRRSLLIVGGYDLANMPDIGYGHQRGGLKRLVSRCDMRLATCVITNAQFSAREAVRNASLPDNRIHVIYHGVEDVFRTPPNEPRDRMALSVGNVDRPNLWRKGHEPFVRAAALLPDVQFVLVGAWLDDAIDYLRAIST